MQRRAPLILIPVLILACESKDQLTRAEAHLEVSPTALDFGSLSAWSTEARKIILRNTGNGDLAITKLELESGSNRGFSAPSLDQPLAIPAGSEKELELIFRTAPVVVPGPADGTLLISSDTGGDASVTLRAMIVPRPPAPKLEVCVRIVELGEIPQCGAPHELFFGALELGRELNGEIKVTNVGDVVFNFDPQIVESDPAYEYTFVDRSELEPGEQSMIQMRFLPLSTGLKRSSVRISETIRVELSGNGADGLEPPPCFIGFFPSGVDFSPQEIGVTSEQSFTIAIDERPGCEIVGFEFTSIVPEFQLRLLSPTEGVITFYGEQVGNYQTMVQFFAARAPNAAVATLPLTGVIADYDCTLEVTPENLDFGVVTLGPRASRIVEVRNLGNTDCVLTVGVRDPNHSAFEADFWHTDEVRPGEIEEIEVGFFPLVVGTATGTLSITTYEESVTVPLSAIASGRRICVDPDPAVFASQAAGTDVIQTITIENCGSEGTDLYSLTLSAESSLGWSLLNPPVLPATLAIGETRTVEVLFHSGGPGPFDGGLVIESNDHLELTHTIALHGSASDQACGEIRGEVCGLGGYLAAAGARVYIDTGSELIETIADENGRYVLRCVPEGNHQINIELGYWEATAQANVTANQLTVLPTRTCLDPTTAQVAVVKGNDHAEEVLDRLGVTYQEFGVGAPLNTAELFVPARLAALDIIIFNCLFDESVLTPENVERLRAFVDRGGSIIASDFAYDVVELGWPDLVDFYGDDNVLDAAIAGSQVEDVMEIHDPDFVRAFGIEEMYAFACCVQITSIQPEVTPVMIGQMWAASPPEPVFIHFRPTPSAGRVVYSTFHHAIQHRMDSIEAWLLGTL